MVCWWKAIHRKLEASRAHLEAISGRKASNLSHHRQRKEETWWGIGAVLKHWKIMESSRNRILCIQDKLGWRKTWSLVGGPISMTKNDCIARRQLQSSWTTQTIQIFLRHRSERTSTCWLRCIVTIKVSVDCSFAYAPTFCPDYKLIKSQAKNKQQVDYKNKLIYQGYRPNVSIELHMRYGQKTIFNEDSQYYDVVIPKNAK